MNIKEKIKKGLNLFLDSFGGVIYVGILSFIAFCVAIIFKKSEFGYLLEIKDYFNFAGAFGGAILSGFISLVILKVTLTKQKEQFDEERTINATNKGFEIKVKKIDDLLLRYKDIFNICTEFINEINKFETLIKSARRDGESKETFNKIFDEFNIKISEVFIRFEFYESLIYENGTVFEIFYKNNIVPHVYDMIKKIYNEYQNKNYSLNEIDEIIIFAEELKQKMNTYINNLVNSFNQLNKEKFELK
ncbi:hypothetical protein BH721_01415 [Clostridium baratii]|uniref:hypothetical protein n=1 Tax=Clostridium baratii TaxID=1561 RepID=UPI0009A43902|nr:hypothetical protein [Clostridium baratii]OPF51535.1 hypothetical protein A1M12_03060 [Clostridium baratii]OPF55394.1 hypothetical protein BH721_01415 [Clostridium baratii]OPF57677.1 hypothetical protein BH724_08670 [Clostridium baratii]OPF60225.1 hypothetical protein BH725_06510 [Clostridium baratii]